MKKKIFNKFDVLQKKISGCIAFHTLPEFANYPLNLEIQLPRRIRNPHKILIGDNVKIGPNSVLSAQTQYPTNWLKNYDESQEIQRFDPTIIIGDRVTATGSLQIFAFREIAIEADVMFASNIYISDGFHGYQTANIPYKYQKIFNIEPVTIKKGCWIGQNVVINPGVTIGENSIIGANSVVTKDISSKSIAFGNPAHIHKIWDEKYKNWVSIK